MDKVKAIAKWLKNKWWIVLIVLVVGGVIYWQWQSRQAQTAQVDLINPEYRDIVKTTVFSGRVDARERVGLRFAGVGKLSYIGAKQGDFVKRGQTIASLDQRTVQKQLDKALSMYQTERWAFEEEQAARPDIIADETLQREADLDQFSLNRSVLDVELQYLSFDNYRISAPFDGILVSAPIEVTGVTTGATDAWEIINPDTLYFKTWVDEVDFEKVKVGQPATIVLDAYPDREYLGQVAEIDYQTMDTIEGSVFAVKVVFAQPVSIEEARVGMNGEARLLSAEKRHVLSVPIETLISREGQSYVEVMVNNQRQEKAVTLGLENDDYAEILEGLSEDDQVILP